jgi:hypothetical protein
MIAGIHNGVKWAYNLCKDAIAINAFVVEFVMPPLTSDALPD